MRESKNNVEPDPLKLVDLQLLGGVIRKLREQRGWSQRQLADLVKCDPAAISLVENGNRGMSLPFFEGLAQALDVDPTWLMILAFPPTGNPKKGACRVDELGKQLKKIIHYKLFGEALPKTGSQGKRGL